MTEPLSLEEIANRLGHVFRDLTLLRDALTHRSFVNERPKNAPHDNERLEFLGDAVVSVAASSLLWERFPEAAEGELTRRRADLVCEAGLATIARELGLGRGLRLGRGEERSGGRDKPRLLASAFEACMAAIYLDGGIDAAMQVGRELLARRIAPGAPGSNDFKSRVQEIVQAKLGGTPRYVVLHAAGPDHAREFSVAVMLDAQTLGRGTGRSKLEAEQAAAKDALSQLGEQG